MKTRTSIFKRLTFGVLLASVPLVGGCGDNTLTWQEEVKLLDGRVITVTQKRRYDTDKMPREAWLTFKLPEFGNQEIVWHENLEVQVLNVYQGKLYVVGYTYSAIEFRQYGRPKPSYIGFRYDTGQWTQLRFNEIPEAIYDTNMYFENMAVYRLKHVSLADKDKMLKDDEYMQHFKKIDPKWVLRTTD